MSDSQKCKDRIQSHLVGRIADLKKLFRAYQKGQTHPELGEFNEYGLAFDYVSKGTFNDQKEGYFRYQLSWGGPSDEFRFYTDAQLNLSRVEYWFLDWFDGAHRVLKGKKLELLESIFEDFKESGTVQYQLDQSKEGEE